MALVAAALGVSPPDPYDPGSSDPEISAPDTWEDVALAAGLAVSLAGVAGLLMALAVAMLIWASQRRWLRPRWLAIGPAIGGALFAVPLLAVLAPQLDEGRSFADCDTFAFRSEKWTNAKPADRLQTANGIAACRAFKGYSRREVLRRLGRPAEGQPGNRKRQYYSWIVAVDRYEPGDVNHDLTVYFVNGRVATSEGPGTD